MNQYKAAAPVLLLIIAIVAGYFFAYPQWQKLVANRLELTTAQKKNDELKKSKADIQKFISEYMTHSAQAAEADKILPPTKVEIYNVLGNMHEFSKSSQLTISSVTVNESTAKVSPYAISYADLEIVSSGTYEAYKTFMNQLENSLRVYDIIKFSIGSSETNDMLQIQMVVRVYYQK